MGVTNVYHKNCIFFILIIQIFFIQTSQANKSWSVDGQGGSMAVPDDEHASISMLREWVRMDIYDEYYTVKAQFVFHNEGPAVNVKMGFPEYNEINVKNDYEENPGFLWYKEWVDGNKVDTERKLEIRNRHVTGHEDETYLWVTELHFRENQKRVVRVEYRAKSGSEVLGEKIAAYSFSGKNWKSDVREASFLAVMHVTGAQSVRIDGAPSCLIVRENRLSGRWKNWRPDATVSIWYGPTSKDAVHLVATDYDEKKMRECEEHYLFLPGEQKNEVVFPSALLVKGTVFIDIRSLWDSYDKLHKCNRKELEVLECPNKTIKFRIGEPEVEINNRKIPLSAEPFDKGVFYVPAKRSAGVLGGKMTFDEEKRIVRISF